MGPILTKVKAIAVGAGVFLLGGLGVYLTTDVDYETAFGPGVGMLIATGIGFTVREGFPKLIEYLRAQSQTDVTFVDDAKVNKLNEVH